MNTDLKGSSVKAGEGLAVTKKLNLWLYYVLPGYVWEDSTRKDNWKFWKRKLNYFKYIWHFL